MKVGLIRCMKTQDICSGKQDFMVIRNKKGAFKDVKEEIELIGFNTCGGCPGEKAVTIAQRMVSKGADTIALSSCITKGRPIGSTCPHLDKMKDEMEKTLGSNIKILDYTH